MKNMKIVRIVAVAMLLALVAAGCSDEKSKGGGVKIKDGEGGDAALRDDKRTTTTAAAATATTPPTTAPKPTTTAKPAPTTTAVPVSEVKIQDDEQGKPFEPRELTVRAGRVIVWTNVGNKPHSVIEEKGAFRSPVLQPGQQFKWTSRAGNFTYSDGERPYAGQAGILRVQP